MPPKPYIKKVRRRCLYFGDDGNPRDGGCPRSSRTCRFVHPEDEWWDDLEPYPGWYSPNYHHKKKYEKERWKERERTPDRYYDRQDRGWDRERERDDRDRDKDYSRGRERDRRGHTSNGARSTSRSRSYSRERGHNWKHNRGHSRERDRGHSSYESHNKEQRNGVKEEHIEPSLGSSMDSSERNPDRGSGSLSVNSTPRKAPSRSLNGSLLTPISPSTNRPRTPSAPRTLLSPYTNGLKGHSYMDVDRDNSPTSPRSNGHVNGHHYSKQDGYMRSNGDAMDTDSHSALPTPISATFNKFSIPWQRPQPPDSLPPLAPPPPPLPIEPDFFKDLDDEEDDDAIDTEKDPEAEGKDEGLEEAERRELWTERISLMADAMKAYDDLKTKEEEIASANEFLERYRKAAYSEPSTIADAMTSINQLEVEANALRLEANAALDQIVHKQLSWPIFEHEPGEILEVENEAEQEEQYCEMTEYVKELQRTAEEMRAAMLDIVEEVAKENDEELAMESFRVRDEEWGELKRVVPGQELVESPRPTSPPAPTGPPEPTLEEQMQLLNRLTKCETELRQLRELMDRYDVELVESLENMVEARSDDYITKVEDKMQEERQKEAEVGEMTEGTQNDLEEISTDMQDLDQWLTKLVAEIELEEETGTHWNMKLEELSERLSYATMEHTKTRETIQSLRSQLHTYLSAPPSPPPSPTPDLQSTKVEARINYILSESEETIKNAARAAVIPLVESVREELESFFIHNKRYVESELEGRLGTTMRVMDALYGRIVLSHEVLGNTMPVVQ